MFFPLSKILFFILQPSSLIAIAILAGLVLARSQRWRRAGGRLAVGGIAALLIAGLTPFGNALLLPLEQRFPAADAMSLPNDVAGMIVLGGFEDTSVLATRRELGLNRAAERVTEAARLARAVPRLKVVFTGGVGALIGGGTSAAGKVGEFFADMGIARDRLILEGASRNTYENARLTVPLLAAAPGSRWLLVTSAFHMPRSIGIFRQAGVDVIAYPVDFRAGGGEDLWLWFKSIPEGLERVDVAAKEWIGLLAYRAVGYTDALFPTPDVSAVTSASPAGSASGSAR